jgi:hypothetical protein
MRLVNEIMPVKSSYNGKEATINRALDGSMYPG